ncbi:MAG: MBL fold metallo-hydrolase [Deltaproteobacteria bacterium]|nr:MBL fold metallo-hydrolase [Deltaproteobacteria bacterium]
MQIRFLGATGTVTGSKTLVTSGQTRVLVDCGLFQGWKQLRLRNREPLPHEPSEIDAVVLTHAHLDHSGYLPLLVRNGFRGPVFCTRPTADLCSILLPDSGRIQEEDAAYANRAGFSKHRPARALYTEEDAVRSLERLRTVSLEEEIDVGRGLRMFLTPSGHILGSAFVELRGKDTSILFSGDLGRPNDTMMAPPATGHSADYVVIESTYGNRRHDAADPADTLASIVCETVERRGSVLIPAFAVGRTQSVLRLLYLLRRDGRIPKVPIFLDSPMAIGVTKLLHAYPAAHRLSPAECEATCAIASFASTVEDSKRVVALLEPKIVIAASGMASGGRVLHHLKALAPGGENTIAFTGFQAGGTRGAALLDGAQMIKIHGEYHSVRARVRMIENLSAHADQPEILDWLRHLGRAPRRTFINHGEPDAADALRLRIQDDLRRDAVVPGYLDVAKLG